MTPKDAYYLTSVQCYDASDTTFHSQPSTSRVVALDFLAWKLVISIY